MTAGLIINISQELGPKLSPAASIHLISSPEDFEKFFVSWSGFNRKEPSAVVKIATEEDAIQTVLWATSKSIPFAVKGGGHSTFCTIGKEGIIIDLTAFNHITVHEETVDVQGGTLTEDVISAVFERGRCVVTGTCDKVGVTGAVLGGGVGPIQGVHGMMIDNLLSARVITAEGKLVTASETENPDLFWALRGAGHRFGLVTQVTFKTHDLSSLGSKDGSIWNGFLVWGEHQLEQLTDVIGSFNWNKHTSAYFAFASMPPDLKPTIVTVLIFFGSDEEADEYFKPILSLVPVMKQIQRLPYNLINMLERPQQQLGGNKFQFGAGVQTINSKTMVEIYKKYSGFVTAHPDAVRSAVVLEIFGMDKVREIDSESTAFPHRDVNFWTFPLAWYEDPATESDAKLFGNEVRQLFRDGDSREKAVAYVNFNHGDESHAMTYGSEERVEKLLSLKKKWDPSGVFGGGLVPQLE